VTHAALPLGTKSEKLGISNSMAYRLPTSRNSQFVAEPAGLVTITAPYAFVNSPAAVIIRIGEDGVVLVHEVCATILWHGGSVRRDSLRRTSHEKNRSDHQTL
jgi:hypothetical protein